VAARRPGRPRTPGADQAILDSAAAVLAERGVAGTTVAAVATRAGVARATIYRRWPTRDALVAAAAKAVVGGEAFALTGRIDADLRHGADFMRDVLAAPYFTAILPELVRAVLEQEREVTFEALAPNRAGLAALFRADAGAQGFERRHSTLAFDLLFGAGLTWMLATGRAPSRDYMRSAAEVILRGLRREGSSDTRQR
jgi:AcrR family transcriptional regulator